MLESPQNFNQFSFFSPYFFPLPPQSSPNVSFYLSSVTPSSAVEWSVCWVPGSSFVYLFLWFGELDECETGWLINTKFLLQTMPFSPSMHKPQAATFPWAAAAPVGRAPGPRQWVQLLSRAQSLSFVFLLSILLFAVLRTVCISSADTRSEAQINSKFWMGV